VKQYRAIVIAPDGDWATDFRQQSIEDVEESLRNMGSRWYFYPFHGVITVRPVTTLDQRLVSVAHPFEEFKGRTIRSLTRHIASLPESELIDIIS
jgi:hypothetical protein